ncbi:M23 family metallopeptidase [Marinicella sp. S1101]|uniref:M23 family metallopeptidase n=1 Tax=Marinicella marina TaxID=2996016 RepID=UPI002260CEC4|nr:M23 family metallopeptidase [Marinicella marina]MCX7554574.1 M23 family metallopeptidase [Marinicella marina]MDJ1141042.1 M23 family metallopeptidase [Marinicella marina]
MNNLTIIKHKKTGMVQYSLSDKAVKTKLFVLTGLFTVTLLTVGGLFGAWFFGSDGSKQAKIKELQSLVDSSQQELIEHKKSIQNDIDSMTLQIGKLMAHSTRLNALGSRLTEVADINQEEFNLDAEPGVGGAALELTGETNTPQSLYENLFNLEDSFSKQQENFNILAKLLNEQDIEQSSTPHVLPLEKGWISSYYGKRIDPFTGQQATHPGMDYSGAYKSSIVAAADGVVVWAGKRSSYGKMVEIDHGNGFMTRYAHAESIDVELGQKVTAGEKIAVMGKTGRATSEHLHFEILKNGRKVNPLPFVNS